MIAKSMHVRLTLTEPLLGTSPTGEDVYREFIASKAPDAPTTEEEVAALGVDEAAAKGMTVFQRDADGNPYLYDYMIKGFFKDACGMLARLKGATRSAGLRAYKKIIDGLIFVSPRRIPLVVAGEIGKRERPLRAATAQGERMSLASSEELPAGTVLEFSVDLLDPAHEAIVREWLDYGSLRGLGQWRNSGCGRFSWVEVKKPKK